MCSQTRNSCAKAFDNRSRSKSLKPKKKREGVNLTPPPPPSRLLGLNRSLMIESHNFEQYLNMTQLGSRRSWLAMEYQQKLLYFSLPLEQQSPFSTIRVTCVSQVRILLVWTLNKPECDTFSVYIYISHSYVGIMIFFYFLRESINDGFRSGCRNVSQHQQQSFSGLHYKPERLLKPQQRIDYSIYSVLYLSCWETAHLL